MTNTGSLTTDSGVTVTNQSNLAYNCWDNPDGLVNYQTYKTIYKTINCGLLPSLFIIGAPANILTMVIFYRQGLQDRMNVCLFCLAGTELLYVTAVLVKNFFCFITIFLPHEEDFWRWTLTKHTLNFVYGSAYSSGCLTMIIAVERCVCVIFPMKAATLISTKKMTFVLMITILITQGLCGVYVIKDKVSTIKDVITGEYRVTLVNTELFLSNGVFKIIENIVLSFLSFFSFSVLLCATVTTVVSLRSAMAWRKASTVSYLKGQAVLMRMLMAVCCIHILCAAPNLALALTRFSVAEFRPDGRYCNLFQSTHFLGHLTVMFNSSINFFVYVTMSSRFRSEVKDLFCPSLKVN